MANCGIYRLPSFPPRKPWMATSAQRWKVKRLGPSCPLSPKSSSPGVSLARLASGRSTGGTGNSRLDGPGSRRRGNGPLSIPKPNSLCCASPLRDSTAYACSSPRMKLTRARATPYFALGRSRKASSARISLCPTGGSAAQSGSASLMMSGQPFGVGWRKG